MIPVAMLVDLWPLSTAVRRAAITECHLRIGASHCCGYAASNPTYAAVTVLVDTATHNEVGALSRWVPVDFEFLRRSR